MRGGVARRIERQMRRRGDYAEHDDRIGWNRGGVGARAMAVARFAEKASFVCVGIVQRNGCDRCAVITVELSDGRLVRISAEAPAGLVAATLKALR